MRSKKRTLADAIVSMNERMFLLDGKDITFKLADCEVDAHSVVLRAVYDVFNQMLQSDMTEGISHRINLPEVTAVIMKVFLRFLYTGIFFGLCRQR